MRKLTSRAFRKCCSFRVLKVLNQSYWLLGWVKIEEKILWRGGVKKNNTATILSFDLCHGIRVGPIWLAHFRNPQDVSSNMDLAWICVS